MQEKNKDWYFIVNPRAGSGKTMSQWVPAEKQLEKLGISYITAYTDHQRHATSLAYEAAEHGYRKILAVGGDGSLHETLSGIIKWCDDHAADPMEFYLGVAPIGSGNDWIKSLNVPHDIDKVIDLLAKESFGQMDVVRVHSIDGKTSYMANVGGLGFDSHVCVRVNQQKESGMRGKRIYLNALLNTLRTLKPLDLRIIADGNEVFSGTCYSVALGNGKFSGSGMRQVPRADINDGLLDVMIVPKQPLLSMLSALPRLFNGTIYECPKVYSLRCSSLQIMPLDDESNDIIEIDGEIEGRIPLSIEMGTDKINVIKG